MRAILRGAAPLVCGAVPTSNTFPHRASGALRGALLSALFFALLIGGAPAMASVDAPQVVTGSPSSVEPPVWSPEIAGAAVATDPLEIVCLFVSPLKNPGLWLLCELLGY